MSFSSDKSDLAVDWLDGLGQPPFRSLPSPPLSSIPPPSSRSLSRRQQMHALTGHLHCLERHRFVQRSSHTGFCSNPNFIIRSVSIHISIPITDKHGHFPTSTHVPSTTLPISASLIDNTWLSPATIPVGWPITISTDQVYLFPVLFLVSLPRCFQAMTCRFPPPT